MRIGRPQLSFALLPLFLLLWATPALSQNVYSEPAFYVGAGYSRGFSNFDIPRAAIGDSNGAYAWGGYRFHRFLSAELVYEYNAGYNVDVETMPLTSLDLMDPLACGCVDLMVRTHFVGANAKAYWPDLEGFQPFVLFGGGYMHSSQEITSSPLPDATSDGFALRFGAGFDLFFSELIGINVTGNYVLPVTGGRVKDFQYFSMGTGLVFRF